MVQEDLTVLTMPTTIVSTIMIQSIFITSSAFRLREHQPMIILVQGMATILLMLVVEMILLMLVVEMIPLIAVTEMILLTVV
ncbi:hypothetical protein C7H19_24950 [Aphanothece hegewaldii CCALA 016]|uniref:Uncharacterized protein n=1 Tax=Aphanothece hegewaldii CCALA 016 TaxID=2107694 RepID=A0A2T1LQF9_9CHRO|nr:hypothetical protein C7H19_24950 [Aphanothece hegewaldii CCALA 016]